VLLAGKTASQRREIIRLAAKRIGELARRTGKPVVVERLDFSEKKRAL
jgi:hypothetical protein